MKSRLAVGSIIVTLLAISTFCAVAAQVVHWTAPGDDDMIGTADHYEFRCAQSADSLMTHWADCRLIPEPPAPETSGTAQQWDLTNFVNSLPANTTFYIMARALDEAGNIAPNGNIISVNTRDTIVPAAILDLRWGY